MTRRGLDFSAVEAAVKARYIAKLRALDPKLAKSFSKSLGQN